MISNKNNENSILSTLGTEHTFRTHKDEHIFDSVFSISVTHVDNKGSICRISDSLSSGYEEFYLPGYNTL
jgi:uncharacterized protein (DUF2267 family)